MSLCFSSLADSHSLPVKIGVLAKRGKAVCLEKWTPTADYLTRSIPHKNFIIIPLDHEEINIAVKNDELDFIFANPSYYVAFEKQYGAKRIATLKNIVLGEMTTLYGSVVFVRSSRNDIRCLEDLKNKSFMAVDDYSLGGWRMVWRELENREIDYRDYFSRFEFGGTHDAVIYAVKEGLVDAGTVRTDTLERMQGEGKLNLSDFYVIPIHQDMGGDFPFQCSTRVYPEWPFAEAASTSDQLAESVLIALLQIRPDDPAAIAAGCAGWTIPLNYQSVHECLKDLKVAPYENLGKITFAEVFRKYWYAIVLTVVGFGMMGGFLFVIQRLNRHLFLSNRQLNDSYHALKREIEERKKTEIKLINAKKMAETATRAKSQFLANISHEIRTPLNGVIASAELALGEAMPSKAEHYLSIIRSSAYSLLGIINDILDFSNIEAGKFELEKQPFRLDTILDRIADLFIKKAAEKHIEVLFDIDINTPRALCGDVLRLQQILINLVSNAVKFTGKGGVILIGVQSESSPGSRAHQIRLHFYVKDTGIGMAPEFLPKLFSPFTQADASSTRKYSGTGLGLSICKQLVGIMNGEIWAESRPGEGSTFHFSIDIEIQSEPKGGASVFPNELQHMRVLVVDDNPESLTVMQNMLQSFGLHAIMANSGQKALQILKDHLRQEQAFQVIIMDCYMPDMDGIETARRIREDFKLTTPIFLMTTFGRESARAKGVQVGINGFLTKPIYPSTLLDAIMDIMRQDGTCLTTMPSCITTESSIYRERLKGTRILVADDNQTNQEIVAAILKEVGIRTTGVENGRQVLEAIERETFDAVLMDIQMPVMDGIEASCKIRRKKAYQSLPIIAMTAHAMKGEDRRCLESGMNAYISKPIHPEYLFHTIWKLIRGGKYGTKAKAEETTPHICQTKEEALPKIAEILEIEVDMLVPLFVKLMSAIDLADPEAVQFHLNVIKKHMDQC
jgi:signal transduction histidine kinase/CheY-like chemotaxis protein/ABC-type phosphate/phosphonate transport system substrate-binding protein